MALSDSLLSYWKFDGNSNDAVSSKNGTDSNISYNASYGKINQGASFNGSSSEIVVDAGSGTILDLTADLSISFWIKTTQQYGGGLVFFGDIDPISKGYGLIIDTTGTGFGKINMTVGSGSWFFINQGTAINDGNWNHAVFTVSGVSVNEYINNSFKVSAAWSGSRGTWTGNRVIGNANEYGKWFNGYMDEIGVWSRALTTSEISTLYNGGSGLQYPFGATATVTPKNLGTLGVGS